MSIEGKDDDALKIVETADGGAVIGEQATEKDVDTHEDHPADDEDTAKVDSELDEAETEEEREAIRVRRRAERKSRSQRNRERVEALERNLQAVIERNATLEAQVGSIQSSSASAQLAQVDAAIQQSNKAAETFKRIIGEAVAKGDGATVAEATEHMIAARARAKELSDFKVNAARSMNAPRPLDQRMVSKSQEFMTANQWYSGPQSADPDSKVLTAVDNSLAAEGWDPTSDSYWNELKVRAAKYLPHRFGDKSAAPRQAPKQAVPGGDAVASNSRQSSFTLSPERVKAIKSAGMWDDPASRNKMIKQYRDYDKSQ